MDIKIFQINFSDSVPDSKFDKNFSKYDCRENPEPLRYETVHMINFYHEHIKNSDEDSVFGLLSPSFSDKTLITGQKLIDTIKSKPGYDVYFINPFPENLYLFYNVWTQGEYHHPNLIKTANKLLEINNYDFTIEDLPRSTYKNTCFANYWVAKKSFWDIYIPFLEQLTNSIENSEYIVKQEFYQQVPYRGRTASVYPFIFERLFSTFITLYKGINTLPLNHLIYPNNYIQLRLEHFSKNIKSAGFMDELFYKEFKDYIDHYDASQLDDNNYKKLFESLTEAKKNYTLLYAINNLIMNK